MAIKKSELYSSLWAACDALRGGMDASQYKDYVLVLLFIKYISDKYAGQPFAPVVIPAGSSFEDMRKLKGTKDIGDDINKKIIAPLIAANSHLSQSDFPDFNDAAKLGTGKDMVDRLTDLIAIFERKDLDFSKNRADGDDILGDAYEYLMRHFATESGKSKGQFYTPSEVSQIIAKVIGIGDVETSPSTTVYDPTCGSGSLLIKVGDEAKSKVALYGQEKDYATSGLARMNMYLHDYPEALIRSENTLANPQFLEGDGLKVFDYVVANPPFSDKRWSSGLHPNEGGTGSAAGEQAARDFKRFEGFGTPPAKQGDYAYLLHIIKSLKSTGKGACILPHGVLFRGNSEAEIRKNLIRRGYIKGIIGLPANLFYGTGIPACVVVLDKHEAHTRKGIFMIDASQGYMKDGPKNRLRAQDIHLIVDAFKKQLEIPKYSRMVAFEEIEKNEFNLNLPRYIDSQTAEDQQDIEGHLHGGIPQADVDALQAYWQVCSNLRSALFSPLRPGYLSLIPKKAEIKATIYGSDEFQAFVASMNTHFQAWRGPAVNELKALKQAGFKPKELIVRLSEGLLAHYKGKPLVDAYNVYQHLMDYWAQTIQDDAYMIAVDGWKAETYRVTETDKKGKTKDKGWTCDLVPKEVLVAHYFAKEQAVIDALSISLEALAEQLAELEEEQGGDEGAFADLDKINKANVAAAVKDLKGNSEAKQELEHLNTWLKLSAEETDLKRKLKDSETTLDAKAYAYYKTLNEADVQTLVVETKWMAALEKSIQGEVDHVSHQLTTRVKDLTERYQVPLSSMLETLASLEAKTSQHLMKMGFSWK
ncbi:MAG: N-6 DNA methylase [Proteobacteria bacterium]|nr:N-6 DNA methylase [Pseudomonadota bacterium]